MLLIFFLATQLCALKSNCKRMTHCGNSGQCLPFYMRKAALTVTILRAAKGVKRKSVCSPASVSSNRSAPATPF